VIPIEEGDRRRRLLKRRSTNLQSGAGEVRTHTNQGPAERSFVIFAFVAQIKKEINAE